jgi:hypothetical protein
MSFTLKAINYKPPLKAEFPKLLTPKPIDQKFEYKNPNHLFFVLINVFVIQQILTCLLMYPMMMWQLSKTYKFWYKVVGEIVAYNVFEIMKINMSYHQTIQI